MELSSSRFRELHQPGNPFVLANAWDIGSAAMLASFGAQAIGTTSAGYAFTLGLPDGGRVPRNQAIGHAAEIAQATALPVSADLENGYGSDPTGVAFTVTTAAEAGLAGCCIEDIDLPSSLAYDRDDAIARIEAAVRAARSSDTDFFLVARADGYLREVYDLDEAITRIQAFAGAGADGVYIPGLPDLSTIERVCGSVDVPVNVLAMGPLQDYTLADFANVGVARVSLGGELARVTQQAIIEAAGPIFASGTFRGLQDGAQDDLVDAMLRDSQKPSD